MHQLRSLVFKINLNLLLKDTTWQELQTYVISDGIYNILSAISKNTGNNIEKKKLAIINLLKYCPTEVLSLPLPTMKLLGKQNIKFAWVWKIKHYLIIVTY